MIKIVSKPTVSVVLPVYNGGKFLAAAIGSIVDQSFQDWELICVNDGSTDQSSLVLDWFANRDPRIRVVHQANSGVVSAANHAHQLARAELVCRMDADDISMPDRLQHQVDFMQSNLDHVAVGGAILEIDCDSEPLGIQTLANDHETIVKRMLSRGPGLFQPASIMRADAFQSVGGFRPKYQWIEDHDLWLRMSQIGRLGNTNELVLCYRIHASSCTWTMSDRRANLMTQLMHEAHLDRKMPGLEHRFTSPPSRSIAGPGKWARKAVRGGYPRTALKHLKRLWKENGLSLYSLRMFAEVSLRLPSAVSLNRKIPNSVRVPNEDKWNAIAASCLTREAADTLVAMRLV